MAKETYIGIIKNDECDTQTLVIAENEENAMEQVLEKFKTSLRYTKDDVAILRFSEVHGGKSV